MGLNISGIATHTTQTDKNHCAFPKMKSDSILDGIMTKSMMNAIEDLKKDIVSWSVSDRDARLQILIRLGGINETLGYGQMANLAICGPESERAHDLICGQLDQFYAKLFLTGANALGLDYKEMMRIIS